MSQILSQSDLWCEGRGLSKFAFFSVNYTEKPECGHISWEALAHNNNANNDDNNNKPAQT